MWKVFSIQDHNYLFSTRGNLGSNRTETSDRYHSARAILEVALKRAYSMGGMVPDEIRAVYYSPITPTEAQGELLSRSVDSLGLSTRALNVLRRLKIQTLGQLAQSNEDNLYSARNCGAGTVSEIKTKLQVEGLDLKEQ